MIRFAIVAEGATDQTAIEAILAGFYQNDDLEVNWAQPLRDETDLHRQSSFGGWELVFEYCKRTEHLVEQLAFNDYLIIQIDTDVAEHVNYGIPRTEAGVDKPVEKLVDEVRLRMGKSLGEEFLSVYRERILYAVCVHSMECWLIPLSASDKQTASRTKSCETHLSRLLATSHRKFQKNVPCYTVLSRNFEKSKYLEHSKNSQASLRIFLDSLPSAP